MTISIALALLAAAIIVLIIWMLRGALLLPVKPGSRQKITLVLHSSEDAAKLENTVHALLWIVQNGTIPAMIVIDDRGLSPDARKTAMLLEKQYACIKYHTAAEENAWENRNI